MDQLQSRGPLVEIGIEFARRHGATDHQGETQDALRAIVHGQLYVVALALQPLDGLVDRGTRTVHERTVARQDQPSFAGAQLMCGCQSRLDGTDAIQHDADPADVIGTDRVADDEEPIIPVPEREVSRCMPGNRQHLPLPLAQQQPVGIADATIDGVRGHGLVEILRHATARIPPVEFGRVEV